MKYFTKSQIDEIRAALSSSGVKDIDFEEVQTLTGDELVAIVQDNENKVTTVDNLRSTTTTPTFKVENAHLYVRYTASGEWVDLGAIGTVTPTTVFSVDTDNLLLGCKANSSGKITLKTTLAWTVTISQEGSWLSSSVNSGSAASAGVSIEFTASTQNSGAVQRQAKVTIASTTTSDRIIIYVNQESTATSEIPYFYISPAGGLEVDSGSSKNAIISNADGYIAGVEYETDDCTVSVISAGRIIVSSRRTATSDETVSILIKSSDTSKRRDTYYSAVLKGAAEGQKTTDSITVAIDNKTYTGGTVDLDYDASKTIVAATSITTAALQHKVYIGSNSSGTQTYDTGDSYLTVTKTTVNGNYALVIKNTNAYTSANKNSRSYYIEFSLTSGNVVKGILINDKIEAVPVLDVNCGSSLIIPYVDSETTTIISYSYESNGVTAAVNFESRTDGFDTDGFTLDTLNNKLIIRNTNTSEEDITGVIRLFVTGFIDKGVYTDISITFRHKNYIYEKSGNIIIDSSPNISFASDGTLFSGSAAKVQFRAALEGDDDATLTITRPAADTWLTISTGQFNIKNGSGSGETSISVSANTASGATTRSSVITVAISDEGFEDVVQTINITQFAASDTLSLSESTWSVTAAGGTKAVTCTTNSNYVTAKSSASWLTYTITAGTSPVVTLDAMANESTTETRTATVTISTENAVSSTVTVTQAAATAQTRTISLPSGKGSNGKYSAVNYSFSRTSYTLTCSGFTPSLDNLIIKNYGTFSESDVQIVEITGRQGAVTGYGLSVIGITQYSTSPTSGDIVLGYSSDGSTTSDVSDITVTVTLAADTDAYNVNFADSVGNVQSNGFTYIEGPSENSTIFKITNHSHSLLAVFSVDSQYDIDDVMDISLVNQNTWHQWTAPSTIKNVVAYKIAYNCDPSVHVKSSTATKEQEIDIDVKIYLLTSDDGEEGYPYYTGAGANESLPPAGYASKAPDGESLVLGKSIGNCTIRKKAYVADYGFTVNHYQNDGYSEDDNSYILVGNEGTASNKITLLLGLTATTEMVSSANPPSWSVSIPTEQQSWVSIDKSSGATNGGVPESLYVTVASRTATSSTDRTCTLTFTATFTFSDSSTETKVISINIRQTANA